MSDWNGTDADRALRAYLRAVIFAEPVQLALLAKYGIRLVDLRALRVLRDLGSVPVSRFAEELGISRSTATGLVDRLEERGLIARTANRTDRRVIDVSLMPRGLTALEDRALFQESALGDRMRALPPEKQRQLADVLDCLVDDDALTAALQSETVSRPEPAFSEG